MATAKSPSRAGICGNLRWALRLAALPLIVLAAIAAAACSSLHRAVQRVTFDDALDISSLGWLAVAAPDLVRLAGAAA